MIRKLVAATALGVLANVALAQTSPVGLWKTIDDDGKTEKSLVRISENAGVLTGTIEKIFDAKSADAKCDKCSDDRKDKPLVGLPIIRGIKQDADDKGLWAGGEILDPNNGKVYKARLKPIDGGKKLEMRGYVGAPMFGRTQTWLRVE
jgi:uncharacterized protein (DUF2147 family)